MSDCVEKFHKQLDAVASQFLLSVLNQGPSHPAILQSEVTVFADTKTCTQEILPLAFLRGKDYGFQSLTSTSWRRTEGSTAPPVENSKAAP